MTAYAAGIGDALYSFAFDVFAQKLLRARGVQIRLVRAVTAEILRQADHRHLTIIDQGIHGAGLAGAQHGLGPRRHLADRPLAQTTAVRGRHVGLLGNAEKHHVLTHNLRLQIAWDICDTLSPD